MQTLKFLTAGGITVILYYAIMYLFVECFKIWYITAAATAFVTNNILNFVLQKFWTFKHRNQSISKKEIFAYSALAIGSTIANCILLYIFVEYGQMHYILAQIVTTVILTIASYHFTKKIFATKPHRCPSG